MLSLAEMWGQNEISNKTNMDDKSDSRRTRMPKKNPNTLVTYVIPGENEELQMGPVKPSHKI